MNSNCYHYCGNYQTNGYSYCAQNNYPQYNYQNTPQYCLMGYPSPVVCQKGDKGDMGIQGQQGTQGIQGIQGIPGPVGPAGPKGEPGDPATQVIANVDYLEIPVGTQGTINVLANDIIPAGVASVIISAPPNPNTEGTVAFVGDPTNGEIIFTPAPDFTGTATFGYQVTDNNGITVSAIVKVNVDTSYSAEPRLLFIDSSNQVNILDPLTGTFAPIITLARTATEIASNRDDAILYYANAGDNNIYIHDYVLGTESILLNYNTELGFTGTVASLGFDQVRDFLYVGFQSGSQILKIAVNPYDRYGTGTQTYTASIISLGVSGFVEEITVEPETGYLIASVRSNGTTILYKIDPVTATILASQDTGVFSAHTSFANDNNVYVDLGGDPSTIHLVNKSTLAIGPALSNFLASLSDFAEPLYNM
ncbi:hypothetical protein QJ856_gp1031 [Tupanvirus deep ocean]|uniref:Uncharacterized protein n=2 Tax=Tupanvirus TaxID=2094720 RepID=A0AC62A7L3_9VIRU|nr:hypothetical protein QJ856_gp1031 [Tupanvirus deep ocean]QKU33726.1 hypothetical protein [Tupanvirus deep ocean]